MHTDVPVESKIIAWRVMEVSHEGKRPTDTKDIVMRTPEFTDNNFHSQKLLGSKIRVRGYGSRIS